MGAADIPEKATNLWNGAGLYLNIQKNKDQ
jgi:hypothetical protein